MFSKRIPTIVLLSTLFFAGNAFAGPDSGSPEFYKSLVRRALERLGFPRSVTGDITKNPEGGMASIVAVKRNPPARVYPIVKMSPDEVARVLEKMRLKQSPTRMDLEEVLKTSTDPEELALASELLEIRQQAALNTPPKQRLCENAIMDDASGVVLGAEAL